MSFSGYFRSCKDEPMMDLWSNLMKYEYARGTSELIELAGNQLGVKNS